MPCRYLMYCLVGFYFLQPASAESQVTYATVEAFFDRLPYQVAYWQQPGNPPSRHVPNMRKFIPILIRYDMENLQRYYISTSGLRVMGNRVLSDPSTRIYWYVPIKDGQITLLQSDGSRLSHQITGNPRVATQSHIDEITVQIDRYTKMLDRYNNMLYERERDQKLLKQFLLIGLAATGGSVVSFHMDQHLSGYIFAYFGGLFLGMTPFVYRDRYIHASQMKQFEIELFQIP